MENIIRAIEAEIVNREQELSALRESLERLRGAGSGLSIMASSDGLTGHYRGLGVGAAVRQFMQAKKSATLDEIREALDRGGISWGKYPKRQVALAVSNSPKIYSLKSGTVTLIYQR